MGASSLTCRTYLKDSTSIFQERLVSVDAKLKCGRGWAWGQFPAYVCWRSGESAALPKREEYSKTPRRTLVGRLGFDSENQTAQVGFCCRSRSQGRRSRQSCREYRQSVQTAYRARLPQTSICRPHPLCVVNGLSSFIGNGSCRTGDK